MTKEMIDLEHTADAVFKAGMNGIVSVKTTADRKVEFVSLKTVDSWRW